ncbi:MAG: tRNA (N(6)-L-threonylcarbamoyladenosine(37)-C(2))-methylthiotransferase MtaB [Bacteroidota bacterium]
MAGKKRIAIQTIGCKLNFAESSSILRQFPDEHYEIVGFSQPADIYIINTCSVTANADKKSRNAIHRAVKNTNKAIILVTGCYSELQPKDIADMKGVHFITGNVRKSGIRELIETKTDNTPLILVDNHTKNAGFFSAFSSGNRTRSFLKIQDGCDNFCSYCTVPYARGRSRNLPVNEILKQVNLITEKGIREIVLSGVNIGDFGKTSDESFLTLLQALDKLRDIPRIRISSIEPDLLNEDIIRLVASSENLMPHFHIPLQSGSDRILRQMNRKYTSRMFLDVITMVKNIIPDANIGADVISGFPGETDEDFRIACHFIESAPVDYLHVFSYSDRPGTKSFLLEPKISGTVKTERSNFLKNLSDEKKIFFYRQFSGTTRNVLFEGPGKNGFIYGFTDNYIRTGMPADKNLVNRIMPVQLTGPSNDNTMNGLISGNYGL